MLSDQVFFKLFSILLTRVKKHKITGKNKILVRVSLLTPDYLKVVYYLSTKLAPPPPPYD